MAASDYYATVREAADAIISRGGPAPTIGVVLGSGLGDFARTIDRAVSLSYAELPHWPPSSTVGHEGRLVVGNVRGRRVAALSGRAHGYEGHDPKTVTFGVRALGLAGVRTLIVTNAAGGINAKFRSGTVMVFDDHINLTGSNPLAGPNDDRFGPRFPDMTEAYSRRLRELADRTAHTLGIELQHGVYAAFNGPSYETPAEIKYLRSVGADAVGMSTVPETIVARHMGIDVLGLSCITNAAAEPGGPRLDHADVMESTRRMRSEIIALLEGIIGQL
jgi:purine-nucleoside phosphorylase